MWSATHASDATHLFRLALKEHAAGVRYNATSEEAIPFRLIAEAVGQRLGVPVVGISPDEAAGHFSSMPKERDEA